MKSSNIEEFNLLVDEYLKQDSRYERQIRNFQSFLKEYGLEDKVFNLYEDNINDSLILMNIRNDTTPTLDLSSGAKQCQYLKVLNSSLLQIFIILTL